MIPLVKTDILYKKEYPTIKLSYPPMKEAPVKNTQPFSTIFRSTAVGISLATMLSLSACGNPGSTPPQPNPTASESSAPSASAESSESPSVSASPSKSKDGKDLPYLIPQAGSTTQVGEPVEDAEARFIAAAKKKDTNNRSDKELLATGYEICGYYFNANDMNGVFDRIESAANGDHDKEVFMITLSGYASKTICPEYMDFK